MNGTTKAEYLAMSFGARRERTDADADALFLSMGRVYAQNFVASLSARVDADTGPLKSTRGTPRNFANKRETS